MIALSRPVPIQYLQFRSVPNRSVPHQVLRCICWIFGAGRAFVVRSVSTTDVNLPTPTSGERRRRRGPHPRAHAARAICAQAGGSTACREAPGGRPLRASRSVMIRRGAVAVAPSVRGLKRSRTTGACTSCVRGFVGWDAASELRSSSAISSCASSCSASRACSSACCAQLLSGVLTRALHVVDEPVDVAIERLHQELVGTGPCFAL